MIIRNSAKCFRCGEEIESRHSHDFVLCACGDVSVDGGKEYFRRAIRAGAIWEDTSLESDDVS